MTVKAGCWPWLSGEDFVTFPSVPSSFGSGTLGGKVRPEVTRMVTRSVTRTVTRRPQGTTTASPTRRIAHQTTPGGKGVNGSTSRPYSDGHVRWRVQSLHGRVQTQQATSPSRIQQVTSPRARETCGEDGRRSKSTDCSSEDTNDDTLFFAICGVFAGGNQLGT